MMVVAVFLLLTLLTGSALFTVAHAQDSLPPVSASRIRVFVDCPQTNCDLDYFRREIAFVDYVRDRSDAQVHVLVTEESTGGGGNAYTASFIGLGRFAGRVDTLAFFAPDASTEDEVRVGLARIFKLGLIPFVAGTPDADRITISYEAPSDDAARRTTPAIDPWNFWVFEVDGETDISGESSYRNVDLGGGISARRTTDALKLGFALDGNYERSSFDLDSVTTVTSTQESYGASAFAVKSLGPHWGARVSVAANRSSHDNRKLGLRAGAGLEFDVFPYTESARRLLTVRYEIGANHFAYDEETIFSVLDETVLDHELEISLDAIQPWGETGIGLRGRQFLDDLGKTSLRFFGDVEVRVVRGLSLEVDGSISRIRDQRYLPAGGLTPEEILLRQQDLATDYRYEVSLGFSYSFGSIYNNVVNRRFGDGDISF
jgi:hypothetical protein